MKSGEEDESSIDIPSTMPLPYHRWETSEETRKTCEEDETKPFTKFSILKNLTVVAMASFLLLGSEDILLMYQSTMNSENGIGVASIAVQYAFGVLSSLYLPKYLIQRFGCKAVMVLSMLTYIPFYLANFHPLQYLMILSSMVLGAGCSLFKGSVDPYINDLAFLYHQVKIRSSSSSCKFSLSSVDKCSSVSDAADNNDKIVDEVFCEEKEMQHLKMSNIIYDNLIPVNHISNTAITDIENSEIVDVIQFKKKQENNLATTNKISNPYNPDIKQVHDIKSDDIDCKCSVPEVPNFNSNNSEQQMASVTEVPKKQTQVFKISDKNRVDATTNKIHESTRGFRTDKPTIKNHNSRNLEVITVRFFGFHSMVYQCCYIFSNLVSYYILQSGYRYDHNSDILNSTCSCGTTYCSVDDNVCSNYNLQKPSQYTRNFLISMCVGLSFFGAVIVILLLDSLKKKDKNVAISFQVLLATFRQMKKKDQLLLVPLTMNSGMMKGFYLADFTKSYIGCAWGIRHVGLVTAFAGATMAFSSITSGWFVGRLGRRSVFIAAAVLNLALNVMLLLWQPDPNQPIMFFVTAGLWGGLFGTFHTQVRAFYGVLFKSDEEAAFGAYQLWYCIGSCLCLCLSNILCNDMKIYTLMAFSTIGIIGFWMVERSHFPLLNKDLDCNASDENKTNNCENQIRY